MISKNLKNNKKRFKKIPIILPLEKNSNIVNLAKKCSVEFDGINLNTIHIFSQYKKFLKNKYESYKDIEKLIQK